MLSRNIVFALTKLILSLRRYYIFSWILEEMFSLEEILGLILCKLQFKKQRICILYGKGRSR